MGNHYTGCIGFADDLTLLTPTISGLKVLIDICEKHAHEHRTVFINDTELYSTQDYPLLVILKQRF